MSISPVEFAGAFERLRNHMESVRDDGALIQLITFWPKLSMVRANPPFASYVTEYDNFLQTVLTADNLRDLSLDELTQLELICAESEIEHQIVLRQIARQCFLVGKLEVGLAACLRQTGESAEVVTTSAATAALSEYESFSAFAEAFDEMRPATRKLLLDIRAEWRDEREHLSTDRVQCIFVQNNGSQGKPRGKLRALVGQVEERPRNAKSDEITFDNQLRASDDPIVGVTYQAMAAIRRYLRSTGHTRLGASFYHAHFSVQGKQASYTGDSIGLATALLAYAQLLHTEALRHDHLLPGDVACTGGIDEAGRITEVNGETLVAKIERAFFSHIKYLVLPTEQFASARTWLDSLQGEYPGRQLVLLPVGSLSAAINDHNIIRPEKVCIGEFVAKKAVKYSRMTKVQVPMLLVLAYLLLCVIYPKAWVGFDWNVAIVKIFENHIEALNSDNRVVWNDYTFEHSMSEGESQNLVISDFNDDGFNEVLIAPPYVVGEQLPIPTLRYYDRNGSLQWCRDCIDTTKYPGDTEYSSIRRRITYFVHYVRPIRTPDSSFAFLTISEADRPARAQVMLFDLQGNKVSGPYLHTGFLKSSVQCGDKIILWGGNNRLGQAGRAVALALNPYDMSGVSPPYDNDYFRLSGMKRGTQAAYVVFPETRLSQAGATRNGAIAVDRFGPQDQCDFKFVVLEGGGMKIGDTVIDEKMPYAPKIDFEFNSELEPTSVKLPDGGFQRLNEFLRQLGQPPYVSQDSLERELLEGVQVYRNNRTN